MLEFTDFEEHGKSVNECAASLFCASQLIRDELKDNMGELDFARQGMVAILDILVLKLEGIARDIDEAIKFYESPAGEETRKALARIRVVNQ